MLLQQFVVAAQGDRRSGVREGEGGSADLGLDGAVEELEDQVFLFGAFFAVHLGGHYTGDVHFLAFLRPVTAESVAAGVAADLPVADGDEGFFVGGGDRFAIALAAYEGPGGGDG